MNDTVNNNAATLPGADMTREEKLAALAQKTAASGSAACLGGGEFYAVNLGGHHLFVPVDGYEGFAAAFLGAE
jgi:hypothetical protein